jgi:hypothetical protein
MPLRCGCGPCYSHSALRWFSIFEFQFVVKERKKFKKSEILLRRLVHVFVKLDRVSSVTQLIDGLLRLPPGSV